MEETPTFPCADKITFDDEKSAKTAAIVADWQHELAGNLVPYRCRYCSLWHLATKN